MMLSFSVGSLTIHYYGIMIATAMLVGIFLTSFFAKRKNVDGDNLFTALFIVLPSAIVGARTLFVLSNLESYSSFSQMIATWNGGMSIFGGIIGGGLGLFAFCKWKKLSFFQFADIIVPSLALGQAIGRWGNFFNQEVFGQEITNAALQFFPIAVEVNGKFFQALFMYESILDALLCGLLIFILTKTKSKGIVTSTYIMAYGIVRGSLELLRQPEYIMRVNGIPVSFTISMLFVVVGAIFLTISIKKRGCEIEKK